MKIAILAFAVAAVALPTAPAAKADQLTAKRQVAELLDAVPVNVGTSLRRPNGDVIVSEYPSHVNDISIKTR